MSQAHFLLCIEKKACKYNMAFQNVNMPNTHIQGQLAGQIAVRSYFVSYCICILVDSGRLLLLTLYNFIATLMIYSLCHGRGVI